MKTLAQDTPKIGDAFASPTKQFFVSMLTRDIELRDALLDLLDNCVDGILRSTKPDPAKTNPYEGFSATIILAKDHFEIFDNCGGIPIETAKKYAFAMGKPEGANDEGTSATVGMYGIGMKRAIFKLGTDALVESWSDTPFVVEFSSDWMASEGWDNLPIYELAKDKLAAHGTKITVMTLNPEVSASFAVEGWIDDFRKIVSQHYSIILNKGLSVFVGNGVDQPQAIAPEPFRLLQATEAQEKRLAPYIYTGKLDDVEVEIYAGLYRKLLTAEEADREEETRGITDDAGWSVACNDRVVVWKDKTRLTGWGEATVPNYHGQFIAITGIVLLRCSDPKKLPLTTTKRGIDASSDIYSRAKDLMRDVTKALTSFTNQWKKFPEKLEEIYLASEYVELPKLREMRASVPLTNLRKQPTVSRYAPAYPEPTEEKTHVVVKFEAQKVDVALLAKTYFGDDETPKPGDVGREAFDRAVRGAQGAGE